MRLSQPRWLAPLPTPVVVGVATLGPIGRKLPAPGTWGSLAGLLFFLVFLQRAWTVQVLLLSVLLLYVAVAFCGEAERRLSLRDPGMVILDEFVVMPLCFLDWPALLRVAPHPAVIWLTGFALFRLFDILKPFGISRLQDLPGGWGVVADDAAAALATCLTMHLAALVWRVF